MFRRKRRMEFARPGERRRREEHERVDGGINRRVFMMRGMIATSFVALGGKLWNMQIAEGGSFQRVAEGNILRFERLRAPRGRVIDRAGRPLAENQRVWSVRIIGGKLPRDDEERKAILDMLAQKLQLKQVLVIDRSLVPVGSEAPVANDVASRLPDADVTTIMARLARSDVALHMLREELTPEDAAALKEQLSDIPGIRVMNALDYAVVMHGESDAPMLVKSGVERELALEIAANTMYMPGVVVDDELLLRHYTGGEPFSHILGYVGPISEDEYNADLTPNGNPIYDPDDKVGRGGVEQALERYLRGSKGGRWVQVDNTGVERVELLERRREPENGLSARLTIDRDFQQLVSNALRDGIAFAAEDAKRLDREPPGAGVAIAMNAQNGDIIAMVSLPTYDNQLFVEGISHEKYKEYQDDEFYPLLDRSIGGLYPPGSTLKPLLAAAALQEDLFRPEETVKCAGHIRVPWTWDETQGNEYPCWHRDIGHGDVDMYRGIAESCDVYFYNIGAPEQRPEIPGADLVHYYNPGDPNRHYFKGLGIERIERYLRDAFGFGKASGIELAGEAEGLVPNPKWLFQSDLHEYWSIGDTINVSIGQGHLLCTPLQMLNGTVAIANGGKLYRPRLIKELIRDDGSVAQQFPSYVLRDLTREHSELPWVKPEFLNVVREGMLRTITDPLGTGHGKVDVPGVVIAGKSGTAEYGEAIDGRYKHGHSWFAAFGPYENPEIAVIALIVGGYEGSTYAGPVVNRILNDYFHTPGMRDATRQTGPADGG
jgi:penicillin-binding protein 2